MKIATESWKLQSKVENHNRKLKIATESWKLQLKVENCNWKLKIATESWKLQSKVENRNWKLKIICKKAKELIFLTIEFSMLCIYKKRKKYWELKT